MNPPLDLQTAAFLCASSGEAIGYGSSARPYNKALFRILQPYYETKSLKGFLRRVTIKPKWNGQLYYNDAHWINTFIIARLVLPVTSPK